MSRKRRDVIYEVPYPQCYSKGVFEHCPPQQLDVSNRFRAPDAWLYLADMNPCDGCGGSTQVFVNMRSPGAEAYYKPGPMVETFFLCEECLDVTGTP